MDEEKDIHAGILGEEDVEDSDDEVETEEEEEGGI